MLCGRDEEQFRFRVETQHALDRRQPAAQDSFDQGEARQAIELGQSSLGGEANGDTRHARQDLEPANLLWALLLR